MNLILVIVINLIVIFIAYAVLSSRIRKNSSAEALERYMREVEALVVQLNSAVDDVVGIAEDRIGELKEFVDKAEALLADPKVQKLISKRKPPKEEAAGKPLSSEGQENLVARTKHLLNMGYTKEEIAEILKISRAEMDFLESMSRR